MCYDICIKIRKKSNTLEILKESENIFKLKNENFFIAVVGNIYNLKNEKMQIEDILKTYYKYSTKISNYLDGTYSLIIYDFQIRKCYIFQDYFRK